MAILVGFVAFFALTTPGAGQAGLRATSRLTEEKVSAEYIEMSLLSELRGALGHGDSERRLQAIEAQLRPTYESLPKSAHGGLDHAVVRFALHRFFVQRHGWYVKGLEPTGDAWNASSPTEMLKDRVPTYVLDLVEKRLGDRGLGLHELAVLAATLEDLVHSEAIERLSAAYSANGFSMDGELTESQLELVINTYMMFFILPGNYSSMTPQTVEAELKVAPEDYPGWDDTLLWVHDLRRSLDHVERTQRNSFAGRARDFSSTAQVVEQVGERFGRFQDLECRSLKEALVQREHQGTGRVRLTDFYAQALDGDWQFAESTDYLRHLGALDETDASQPSVVIPNYLSSLTNCLALSSFYSVCCIDECESLMGTVERQIAAPTASPEQIAKLVASMPSDTVDAPRNLSSLLLRRLDEIAAQHDGKVPLHGRLFAQWMHHAYPRECPFPHVAGAIDAPRTPDEWMAQAGGNASTVSSEDEMRSILATVQGANASDMETVEFVELPWNQEEELVVFKRGAQAEPRNGMGSSVLRNLAFVGVIASMILSMVRTSKSTISDLPMYSNQHKAHYV